MCPLVVRFAMAFVFAFACANSARADERGAIPNGREVLGRPGQRGHWHYNATNGVQRIDRNGREVWTAPAAMTGDLGERTREGARIRREGRIEYYVVGRERDGVRICGEDRSLFAERAVDGSPLEPAPPSGAVLNSTASLPDGYDLGAPAGVLTWSTSSGELDVSEPILAHRLDARRGRIREVEPWISAGTALSRVFWTGGWRREVGSLEMLAFAFGGPADRRETATRVRIVGDGGESVEARLTIPQDASRVFVRLEPARAWRCVSVEFLEPTLRDGRVALLGIEGYGPLDRALGRRDAFERVAEGGRDATALADALRALGPRVVGLVAEEFPRASVRGKARLLSIAEAFPNDPTSVELAIGAFGDDEEVNVAALRVLEANATPAGEDALLSLIESRASEAPMLAGILAKRNFARALLWLRTRTDLWTLELLRSVFVALGDPSQYPTSFASIVEEDGFTNDERAKLCIVLSELHISRPAMRCVEIALEKMRLEESFDTRFRFVRALRVIAPSTPSVDDWLRSEAASNNWILRREALQSLARRGALDDAMRERFRTDEAPRTRVTFYSETVLSTNEIPLVIDGLETERWPMVRVAMVRGLGRLHNTSSAIEAALTTAVDDASPLVRRAAIEATRRRRPDTRRDAAVLARLADEREDMSVVDAAIDYVETRCLSAASDALEARVRRVFRPDAIDDDGVIATRSLRAMLAFGGDAARAAGVLAARDGAPDSWARFVAANHAPACAPQSAE